jgi:hypothetical protein
MGSTVAPHRCPGGCHKGCHGRKTLLRRARIGRDVSANGYCVSRSWRFAPGRSGHGLAYRLGLFGRTMTAVR